MLLSSMGSERKLSEEFDRQHPLRILIAEDNLVNQKLAVRILTKLGYQPEMAGNGKQALEVAKKKEYELILMDGLEATRLIRQQLGVPCHR